MPPLKEYSSSNSCSDFRDDSASSSESDESNNSELSNLRKVMGDNTSAKFCSKLETTVTKGNRFKEILSSVHCS